MAPPSTIPTSLAAYLLHALTSLRLGMVRLLATRAGAGRAMFCSRALRRPPVQPTTMRAVTNAVAATPITVTFQLFIVGCLAELGGLPEVAAATVALSAAARRGVIVGAAGERSTATGRARRHDGGAGRRRTRLVVARHHLTHVLFGQQALRTHLPEHVLPARALLLHRGDLIERERFRSGPARRRRRRRRGDRRLAAGLRRRGRHRNGLGLEQGARDLLMARRQLLIGACRSRWRRHLRVGGRDSEQQKKRGYVRCLAHVGPPGSARGKYRLVAARNACAQALRGRAEQQPCQTSGTPSAAFWIAGLAGRSAETTPPFGCRSCDVGPRFTRQIGRRVHLLPNVVPRPANARSAGHARLEWRGGQPRRSRGRMPDDRSQGPHRRRRGRPVVSRDARGGADPLSP